TVRVAAGVPLLLELHLERLRDGLAALDLPPPPDADAVRRFAASRVVPPGADGALKLVAADGRLMAWFGRPPRSIRNPATLLVFDQWRRHAGSPLSRHKTMSYLENMRLIQAARRAGADEAVGLNTAGRLGDGSRTTLYVVRRGEVLTPRAADGALPGIVRRVLLEAGLAREAALTPRDLAGADAVFLSNALLGIVTVSRILGMDRPLPAHAAIRSARRTLAARWQNDIGRHGRLASC
ncbi:MAG TPA: aminotransferase class IV, partial [Acidobacteriota bacterium]|nr:aminotransferase class IV [Acidobacteriota bacterium]